MKLFIKLFLIFLSTSNLFSAFVIQMGEYKTRPSVPSEIRQYNLPNKIVQENGMFKLFIGPFNSEKEANEVRSNFSLNGSVLPYIPPQPAVPVEKIKQNPNQLAFDEKYAIEVLSSRDIKNVPRRIVVQMFAAGFNPIFVLDKGLYRLLVGPIGDESQALNINGKLANLFGRNMYTIKIPTARFGTAIRPRVPSKAEMSNNGPQVSNTNNSELIGYLEKQRQNALNIYNTDPYGPTTNQNQQFSSEPFSSPSPTQVATRSGYSSKGGLIFSVASMSSKHSLAVNGKQIEGIYSIGFQTGYKVNDNTLFQVSYFAPEIKLTDVLLEDGQVADIKSEYSMLFGGELKYRYFLPTIENIFLSSSFGAHMTKQDIISSVPINFGKSYTANAVYFESSFGMGAGYRAGRKLTLGIDFIAYFTIKTVSNNAKFYFSYEL